MAIRTPTAVIQTGVFATCRHPVAGSFDCVGEIVPLVLVEVGLEDEVIEEYNQKVILMCKPRASTIKACLINCIRGTVGRVYPLSNFIGPAGHVTPEIEAKFTQLWEQIYAPTCQVPDLNYPPPSSLKTEEMISIWKKENTQHLFMFAEGCLTQVGMIKKAQDFKERVEAAGAAFENFESVKLWNYVTLPYKMRKELVAARMIDVPEIVKLPPPNAIFPTPQSVGWKPEPKENASKAVIIKEGCGGKRKAHANAADEARPSSLKKNKTILDLEVTSS